MRILLADDNRFYRQLLEATLVQWGIEVVSVADGDAALAVLLEKDAPKIAVLDWMMPGMTGPEVCQKVRTFTPDNPTYILILTVKDAKEDLLEALKAGADDYLPKPFDNEELKVRLEVAQRIVTLQEKLEQRVDTLENALSEAQKLEAIGQLAGGVAHDFNNVLTIIQGFTDLLLAPGMDQAASRNALVTIKEATQRGASLTRSLLAFSRRQDLHPVPLVLNDVVSNVRNMLCRLIGENIQIKTCLAPDIQLVEADPGQIQQVLINLIINARDAMSDGGTITLSTANAQVQDGDAELSHDISEGAYALISVSDTGCGMSKATLSRIFEPFFTTKPTGKGTGLGLATVYGVIRQSGGHIRVQSEIDKGTTFQIYLPRAQKCPGRQSSATSHPSAFRGEETILIVEDEADVLSFLKLLLSQYGYQVLEASSAEEAIQVGRQHEGTIHLILTDIVMPGMNGYEMSSQLHELRPQAKTVFMTGYADQIITAKSNGRLVLQKPLPAENLLETVRQVLDHPEAQPATVWRGPPGAAETATAGQQCARSGDPRTAVTIPQYMQNQDRPV